MVFDVHAVRVDGKWLQLDVGSRFRAVSIAEKIKQSVLYSAELKQKRKHRSLDANAYFWVMCGKLAAVLGIPKNEIYRQMIREIGDNFVVADYAVGDVQAAIRHWESHGVGWVSEVLGRNGDKISVVQYFGSSVYDTAQMSRLIDIVVEECKAQGIDVMSEQERSLLLDEWSKHEQANQSDKD